MVKLIYRYWKPRGLGNPAKMLMEYGGIDYEFKPVTDRDEWNAEKFSLGLDFPNLPYLIDGEVKLSESWAIYKYLAKKVGLTISDENEERVADMLQGVIQDVRSNFSNSCYRPDFYDLLEPLRKTQTQKIAMIEAYLKNRKFLLGDKLSYLDFALYETLDHHRLFFDDIFKDYACIQVYMKNFEALEKIDAYLKSDRFKVFPITGPLAIWGGKPHNDKRK